MITAQKTKERSYDYTGATYYLEGLIGGIPYQQRQIRRLEEDLQLLHDEMYHSYKSPSMSAWDDGTFQKNKYDNGHNRVIDYIAKEERIQSKINEIEDAMQPILDWMDDLDDESQQIIKLRYWKHKNLEDIGIQHAMSRETVRRLISRCLIDLENKLFEA